MSIYKRLDFSGLNGYGIAGMGFVGSAVFNTFNNKDFIVVYDKYKKHLDNKLPILKKCTYIFACLPTPMGKNGKQDFSAYHTFFKEIEGYEGIVIVKSTVLYSNIKPYLDNFNIVMNPEFLNQNSAYSDMENEKVVILGGEIDLVTKVKKLYQNSMGKKDVSFEMCSIEESINIKYLHNNYHAYKVLFWNMVYEVTGNHRKIFDVYSKLTGNTHEMANVASDGKLGYGGACFPKDVNAFFHEHNHELSEFMNKYNDRLRGE
jgi:UDPglucose 6-dehydrogenase